jgi:hypothetical protein
MLSKQAKGGITRRKKTDDEIDAHIANSTPFGFRRIISRENGDDWPRKVVAQCKCGKLETLIYASFKNRVQGGAMLQCWDCGVASRTKGPNSGVYSITTPDGQVYIGSTKYIAQRWANHRSQLRKRTHWSVTLQLTADSEGIESLKFEQLLACSEHDLVMYEQLAIDAFQPSINLSPTAGSVRGIKLSEHARQQRSDRVKGDKHPMFGKKHREETKRQMSASHLRRFARHSDS